MVRQRLSFLAVPALALAVGCSSSTQPQTTLWEGTLGPVAPANVAGVVAAVSQFGRTEISIEIRLAVEGASYRWGVDDGTCQSPGTLQGGAALYPSLNPGATLTDQAEAALPGQLSPGGTYAARVIRTDDPSGQEVVVACGTLMETG